MANSSEKKKTSIPEWQKNYNQSTASESGLDKPPNAKTQTPLKGQSSLLEQAKQFLNDESIRDASRERKVAFLRKKGLQNDDIQVLLGEAPAPPSEEDSEMKTIHDSTTDTTTQTDSAPVESPAPPAPNRDIPPIITYPEFLLKPQKPPPLVTFQRLVYAAYTFAGISALTYGASKYLVKPMLETLTSARHELAETTLEDLEKFNAKLEANVSHIPTMSSSPTLKRKINGEFVDVDDEESITSDPTELFHRDIATQTSPQHSRSSSTDSLLNLTDGAKDVTAHQSSRLASLKTTLNSLLSSTSINFSQDCLKETATEFQSLLDNLQMSTHVYQTDHNALYPRAPAKKQSGGVESEAAKFKAEIRALKGAFLSSRNFPVARPARVQ